MEEVGKLVKDEGGFIWVVRDDSENEDVMQDNVGADIEHERKFLDFIKRESSDFKVFIDIGAHVGYFSIRLAHLFREVHAFEPSIYNRQGLFANTSLNGIANILISDFAIGRYERKVTLMERGSVSCIDPKYDVPILADTIKKTYDVNMIPLSSVYPKGISEPVIIKIDTEGAEIDIIEGSSEMFSKTQSLLVVEHHECMVKGNKEKVSEILKRLGHTQIHEGDHKVIFTNIDKCKKIIF